MHAIEKLIELMDFISEFRLRRLLIIIVITVTYINYVRIKRKRKKVSQEEEDIWIQETYSKDENGLYPWEADTDDHPSRIQDGSRRISSKWGPKRGRL